MNERIAQALLESVFFEVSALVSIGENGDILGIKLFSTGWPLEDLRGIQNAREIWLISNHPDGNRAPYLQDLENIRMLSDKTKSAPVRLFLSSEYFSCFEAQIPRM